MLKIERRVTFVPPGIQQSSLNKDTNLMSLALLFHYLMLNMFRMLVHVTSSTPAKPQRNNNTHRTRAIQPMK